MLNIQNLAILCFDPSNCCVSLETVQDEKQTKAASNYENPYDVLDFEDQLPKMCIEKCNSHVSDSFQSQYDLERYVEMTGRKASDSNWDFDDPKVSALSGL